MGPEELAGRVGGRFRDVLVAGGEVTLSVRREELIAALTWLRDEPDLDFSFVNDVSCTDWPARDPRVWMAYHLYSFEHGHRIRVKVGLSDGDLRVDSVTPMFPAANWHEREVFDLFGVIFEGHPDLRRILLPDEWEGHPLRKDEPLGGVVTRYRGATVPPPDQRGL
jgi:NADH-quinone oxidoreductase subunit C